jgi:hypothetical protein
MREKAQQILEKHNTKILGPALRTRVIDAMIEYGKAQTETLQTKLNNERKMNESHVNTLLKQIEDKNKTNL